MAIIDIFSLHLYTTLIVLYGMSGSILPFDSVQTSHRKKLIFLKGIKGSETRKQLKGSETREVAYTYSYTITAVVSTGDSRPGIQRGHSMNVLCNLRGSGGFFSILRL